MVEEVEFDLNTYITEFIAKEDEKKRFDPIKIDNTKINNIQIKKNKTTPTKYDITFNYINEKSEANKYENSFVNICNLEECMVCKTVTDTKLYTFYKLNYRIYKCDNCVIHMKRPKMDKHTMFLNIDNFRNAYKCFCGGFKETSIHILPVHEYLKYANSNNVYFANGNSDFTNTNFMDKMLALQNIIKNVYGADYLDRFIKYTANLMSDFINKLNNKQYTGKLFEYIKQKSCIEKEFIYTALEYKLNLAFEKIYWDYRYCAMITKDMGDMDKWMEFISQNDFIKDKYYTFITKKILDAHEFDIDKFVDNFNLATARRIFNYIDFAKVSTVETPHKNSLISVAIYKQKWNIVKILYKEIKNHVKDNHKQAIMYGNMFTGVVQLLDTIFKSTPKYLTKEQMSDNNFIYNIKHAKINDKLAGIIEYEFQNMFNKLAEIVHNEVMIGIVNFLRFSVFSYKCEFNCDKLIYSDNFNKTFDSLVRKLVNHVTTNVTSKDYNFCKNSENKHTDFEMCTFISCAETQESYLFNLVNKYTRIFCTKNNIDLEHINACFEDTYFNCGVDTLSDEAYNICLRTLEFI